MPSTNMQMWEETNKCSIKMMQVFKNMERKSAPSGL